MTHIQTSSFNVSISFKGDNHAQKLMLFLPGRLDSKDYDHMRSHVHFFAEKGYFAASFDPPGTWETGSDMADYTVTHYIQATEELITYFGKKTILFGHSLGGTVAMLVGARLPLVTHIIACMAPFDLTSRYSNITTWQETGTKLSKRDIPGRPELPKKEFSLPYSFAQDAQEYNALPLMKTCTKQKLFIAGSEDIVVPEALVRRGYEEVADPKKLVVLASSHDYRRHPKMINTAEQAVAIFLDR